MVIISCYVLISYFLFPAPDFNLQEYQVYTKHPFLIFNLQAAKKTAGKGWYTYMWALVSISISLRIYLYLYGEILISSILYSLY